MGIKLEGYSEWETKLRNAEKALGFVPASTLSEVMMIGAKICLDECPVGQTGQLKASINYQIFMDAGGSEVGELNVDAPYAAYVNYGTSTTKRVPFFTNAVIAMHIAVIRIMEKNTKAAFDGKLKPTSDRGMGKKGGELKVRKYLYKAYNPRGRQRYVYARGNRPGQVKPRGKIYQGRNYRSRFESA